MRIVRINRRRVRLSLLMIVTLSVIFLYRQYHDLSLTFSVPMDAVNFVYARTATPAPYDTCTLSKSLAPCSEGGVAYSSANRTVEEQCSLKELTQNCQRFLRAHRYLDTHVRQEEKEFPLAFAVRMHRSPEQMEQLLRAIYRPHNFYCIHVDANAKAEVYATIAAVGQCLPNVRVLAERVTIHYGVASGSIVQADLRCMKASLDSGIDWKYVLTLSGQEFPLRTNLEMVRILRLFRGANDIELYHHPKGLVKWFNGSVVRRGGVYVNGTVVLKNSTHKLQFEVFKGSAYNSYTRQYTEAIFQEKRANTILQLFNDSFAPEENVWATINTLPGVPGGYSVEVKHSLGHQASRSVVWKWDKYKCKGDYLRAVCVFTTNDLPWLTQQPQLMANKFMAENDSRVLDCLEAKLFQRAMTGEVTVDYAYFENLPHIKLYRDRGHPIGGW